jgi:hypothetical protein
MTRADNIHGRPSVFLKRRGGGGTGKRGRTERKGERRNFSQDAK